MQCSFYYNSESIDDIICLISSMVRVYIYEILNFQELVEKRCMGGSKACMPIWMFFGSTCILCTAFSRPFLY